MFFKRKVHRIIYKVDGKRLKNVIKGGKESPFTQLDFTKNYSAIYFGGIPKERLSDESLAKKNFSGILQQLVYGDKGLNILQKALAKRQPITRPTAEIVSYGIVVNGSKFIISETEGSGDPCNNDDDEDGCPSEQTTESKLGVFIISEILYTLYLIQRI